MENISMESLLKSLSEAYQKSDYEQVKDGLLKHKESFDSGEFHYNLGTVYSKMGNYAVGRYHLEKSLYEGYESAAAKHNLLNVKESLAVHDISTSRELDDVALATGLRYGADQYVFLTLLILLISLVLFLKKSITKWVFIVFLLISLVPVGTKFLWLDKLSVGVVFSDSDVYEGPSGIFEKTGKVPKGAKVVFGKAIDGWFFVKRPVDYVGWIKSRDVGVIK